MHPEDASDAGCYILLQLELTWARSVWGGGGGGNHTEATPLLPLILTPNKDNGNSFRKDIRYNARFQNFTAA
jgi:hypothetical protein